MTDTDRIAEMIHQLASDPRPCLLCGQPSSVVGTYFPADGKRLGAPDGLHRVVMYCLCDAHDIADPTVQHNVERVIERDVKRATKRRNARWN